MSQQISTRVLEELFNAVDDKLPPDVWAQLYRTISAMIGYLPEEEALGTLRALKAVDRLGIRILEPVLRATGRVVVATWIVEHTGTGEDLGDIQDLPKWKKELIYKRFLELRRNE